MDGDHPTVYSVIMINRLMTFVLFLIKTTFDRNTCVPESACYPIKHFSIASIFLWLNSIHRKAHPLPKGRQRWCLKIGWLLSLPPIRLTATMIERVLFPAFTSSIIAVRLSRWAEGRTASTRCICWIQGIKACGLHVEKRPASQSGANFPLWEPPIARIATMTRRVLMTRSKRR